MENKNYIKRHRFRKKHKLIEMPWLPDSMRPFVVMAIDGFLNANGGKLDKELNDYLKEQKKELKG